MKRLLYGGCLLVFWIGVNLVTGWAQQAIGPRIVVEEKNFDAKQVREGEIIEHIFNVRNAGDRTLAIRKVKPG